MFICGVTDTTAWANAAALSWWIVASVVIESGSPPPTFTRRIWADSREYSTPMVHPTGRPPMVSGRVHSSVVPPDRLNAKPSVLGGGTFPLNCWTLLRRPKIVPRRNAAPERLVAAQREIDGFGLEEVAGGVVDPGADREVARGEGARRIDLVVAILDVERHVAAVMRRPPLMPDRREQVAGVGGRGLTPADFVLAGKREESVHAAKLSARGRGQGLLAERAAADFERRLGAVPAAARRQQ